MPAKDPFKKAESQFESGDFLGSIQLYTLAIELDPNNARYISQRGVAFFRIGKNEEALYDLDMAMKLEPSNPYRYSSRAFILSNLNRIDEAIMDYEKAILLDPEDAIAYNNLGLLQEKKGFDKIAKGNFEIADDLAGVEQKHTENGSIDPHRPLITENKYKNISYWKFVTMVFTDAKVRKEFFQFIRNGLK